MIVIPILTLALYSNEPSVPTSFAAENIDAMLLLSLSAVVLGAGISQNELKQKARLSLKGLPVFGSGNRHGTEICHLDQSGRCDRPETFDGRKMGPRNIMPETDYCEIRRRRSLARPFPASVR
jgi:hypothetical protein